jgi:hypothetical protein
MDKVKQEIEKILEELFDKAGTEPQCHFDKGAEETINIATSSLTTLIIKWLEEKRKTVWILQERQLIDKLITELIGEVR